MSPLVAFELIGLSAMLAVAYIAGRDYANALRARGRAELYASLSTWRGALRRQTDPELERRRAGYLVGLLAVAISVGLVLATVVTG